MNDNEKRKLDSIIVRISLFLFLGFLAVQVWQNVADIAFGDPFPGLNRNVEETKREAEELERMFDELEKKHRP